MTLFFLLVTWMAHGGDKLQVHDIDEIPRLLQTVETSLFQGLANYFIRWLL